MAATATTPAPVDRMVTRTLTVRFLTPAFLGGADQSGRWRTPPFKHLLREWWRVAWCEANSWSKDVDALRSAEAALFGSAAGDTGHRSRVRLRLSRWDEGKLTKKDWKQVGSVNHPEVGHAVGADLYLGYGPLIHDRQARGTTLKANAAIQAGEQAELRVAFPGSDAGLLNRALAWMNAFGAIGGRSRNGWGSVSLEGAPSLTDLPLRDWRECLDRDWAHAIGKDERGPLVWRIGAFDDWRQLMRRLAEIKIGLRTQFVFPNEKPPHKKVQDRHWLAYPVTRHATKAWNRNARLPNTLRFKAVPGADGGLHGRIFHVPCLPPGEFEPERSRIEGVWRRVHAYLDGATGLERAAS